MRTTGRLILALLTAVGIASVIPLRAQVFPGSTVGGQSGGTTLPVADTTAIVKGSATPTERLLIERDSGPAGDLTWTVNSTGGLTVPTSGSIVNANGGGYTNNTYTCDAGNACTYGAPTNLRLASGGVSTQRHVIVNSAKALTAAAATEFVEIAVAQGSVTGGTIEYTIRANDATNYQSRSGVLVYAAVNPAGTEVCTLGRPDGGATVDNTTDIVAVSSGTLTNTFTCVVGLTDAVRIAANAASSLTETTLQITYTVTKNDGTGAITPQ